MTAATPNRLKERLAMDPLLLFAATVVTDESRAAFAAAGQPVAQPKRVRRAGRRSVVPSLVRPVRRDVAATA